MTNKKRLRIGWLAALAGLLFGLAVPVSAQSSTPTPTPVPGTYQSFDFQNGDALGFSVGNPSDRPSVQTSGPLGGGTNVGGWLGSCVTVTGTSYDETFVAVPIVTPFTLSAYTVSWRTDVGAPFALIDLFYGDPSAAISSWTVLGVTSASLSTTDGSGHYYGTESVSITPTIVSGHLIFYFADYGAAGGCVTFHPMIRAASFTGTDLSFPTLTPSNTPSNTPTSTATINPYDYLPTIDFRPLCPPETATAGPSETAVHIFARSTFPRPQTSTPLVGATFTRTPNGIITSTGAPSPGVTPTLTPGPTVTDIIVPTVTMTYAPGECRPSGRAGNPNRPLVDFTFPQAGEFDCTVVLEGLFVYLPSADFGPIHFPGYSFVIPRIAACFKTLQFGLKILDVDYSLWVLVIVFVRLVLWIIGWIQKTI